MIVRAERFFGRGAAFARAIDSDQCCIVERMLPGEVAEVELEREGYLPRARLIALQTTSAERVVPPCPHYETCDGCALLHASSHADGEHARTVIAEVIARHAPSLHVAAIEVLTLPTFEQHRTRTSMHLHARDGVVRVGLRDRDGSRNHIPDCPALDRRLHAALAHVLDVTIVDELGAGAAIELLASDGQVAADVRELGPTATAQIRDRFAPMPAGWLSPSSQGSRQVHEWVAALGVCDGASLYDATAGRGDLAVSLAGRVASILLGDVDHVGLREAAARFESAGGGPSATRAGRVQTIAPRLVREGASFDIVVINPMRESLGDETMRALAQLARRAVIYLGPAPRAAAPDLEALAHCGFGLERLAAAIWYPRSGRAMLCALLSRTP